MSSLLIVQHEDDTPPGSTLEWAKLRNLEVALWRPDREPTPPTQNFVGVVICGGSMDTFQEDKYPWLKTEKKYVRAWLESKTKIFGLCLGSQLLAEALGGPVHEHRGWEIGFIPVKALDGKTLHVYHWHRCTFELPPEAQRILRGDYCENQAFRWSDNIVATQFHPESTVEWIRSLSEELQTRHTGNVQSKEQMLENLSLQKPLQEWYFAELDRLFLRK